MIVFNILCIIALCWLFKKMLTLQKLAFIVQNISKSIIYRNKFKKTIISVSISINTYFFERVMERQHPNIYFNPAIQNLYLL